MTYAFKISVILLSAFYVSISLSSQSAEFPSIVIEMNKQFIYTAKSLTICVRRPQLKEDDNEKESTGEIIYKFPLTKYGNFTECITQEHVMLSC